MRMLHPVTQREKFVASGTYRYKRGGVLAEGSESFSIYALPDGSWFVRVDYDWRMLDGTSQLIEALIDPPNAGGRFQRIVAQLHSAIGITRETVDFHPDHVLIGVGGIDGVRRDIDISMPEDYAVLMLKTTLAGIGAGRWPAEPGQSVKAFAGYRGDIGTALTFESTLHALPDDNVVVGSQVFAARVVELSGEFSQTLWLDPFGIAVRRTLGETTVDLHDYSYRPEAGA